MTVCAAAFHENTFAVFEIEDIRRQINHTLDLLLQHDQAQHP